MSEPIISVSGLRGVVGESVTPDLAVRYVAAFASRLPAGPVVVSRDGRASGAMLAAAVQAALAAVGRDVLEAGIAATPTTGVLVRQHRAAAGIQISASHNPAEYNGIKLFCGEGRVISAAAGGQVIERFHKGQIDWAAHDRLGTIRELDADDSVARHAALVLAIVDADAVRRRRFNVLLDANHGAGSLVGRRLLEQLGCRVTLLGGEPDGLFDHPPEPTAENLQGVLARVGETAADVGFCQDPDADRLAVIDEQGRYLGEEATLAMCVDQVLRREPGPIVTNCSTSRMAQDLAERYGAEFFRSAVGEANVTELMRRRRAVFGGEGNGGVIDPRVGYVRDSFVGMALLLDAMASRDLPISALADELPRLAIVKTKATLPAADVPAALDRLERHFADAVCDRLDGLRLDWPGKWLLIRASNTEPIVRLVAEARSADEARRLCDEAARVVSGR